MRHLKIYLLEISQKFNLKFFRMENQDNNRTIRNKKKLEHWGYLYIFEKQNRNGTKKFWRCEQVNTKDVKCKAAYIQLWMM